VRTSSSCLPEPSAQISCISGLVEVMADGHVLN
jgi:hypothetical protein